MGTKEPGTDLAHFTNGDELAGMPSEKAITILHSRKRKILEAARNNEAIQEVIFVQRENIAAFFRQHGGKMHEETAQIFERLEKPQDIIPFIPQAKTELVKEGLPEERVNEHGHTRPGYFVLGKELTKGEERFIQEQRGTAKRKTGSPMHNQWRKIFLEREHDSIDSAYKRYGRAIYINEPRTPELLLQLEILCNLNPAIMGHLFFLEFSPKGKVIVTPFTSVVTLEDPGIIMDIEKMSKPKELTLRISEMLQYEPQEGDVHIGTISHIGTYGVTIQITPKLEAYMPLPENTTQQYTVGEKISVVLQQTEWSRFSSGRFKRSSMEGFFAKETKDINDNTVLGKTPVFSEEHYAAWDQFATGKFTSPKPGSSVVDTLGNTYPQLEGK